MPQELAKTESDSVGYAIPGAALQIVREDGSEAATDEEGEIVHSGFGTFQGYWGDAGITKKTRRKVQDKNLDVSQNSIRYRPAVFTGDIGRMDERGMLYLCGRRDRQVKSMGVKINPEEIELLMRDIPIINEIAIVSKYNEIIGDKLIAVVAPDPGINDPVSIIKKHCTNLLGRYMEPRQYVLTNKLPRTTSGKIDYAEVRKLVQT